MTRAQGRERGYAFNEQFLGMSRSLYEDAQKCFSTAGSKNSRNEYLSKSATNPDTKRFDLNGESIQDGFPSDTKLNGSNNEIILMWANLAWRTIMQGGLWRRCSLLLVQVKKMW